jgi:phage-related minor tail protein
MNPFRSNAGLSTLSMVALLVAMPVAAATYKWVDDKGVVHYTDKMPAEAVDKANVELNKQGIPIKRNDPAPSLEQRRAKAAEEERHKQLSRERELVDRRDRALMQSYTSEQEIDLARTRALATIDTQVQSAQAYSVQLTKRRNELEAKRKSFGDKAPPPAFERELESIAEELAKQDALVADKKREAAAVTARYDADKARWLELRAIAQAKEGLTPTSAK